MKESRDLKDCFTGKRTRFPGSPMRPRKITAQERAWLVRGLNSLTTGKYAGCHAIDLDTGKKPPLGKPVDPKPYLKQLDTLVIVEQCRCGQKNCHTVNFRQSKAGRRCTIVHYQTDDGRLLIIDANRETGKLAGLEIV